MRPKTRYALIAACAAAGAAACAVAVWRAVSSGTYLRFRTMFGTARVYQVLDDEGEPVRLLEVGGVVQSGTYLEDRYTELVFDYLKRYDELFQAPRPVRDVLVLGCGGYDYPEHLVAHHPGVTVDAVEVDPAITAIARRYFYLDRLIEEYGTQASGRLNLFCDDALAFLFRGGKRYDAIVNDAFDAGTPPAHLTTREFARAARDRLRPGGRYLTNIVAPLRGEGAGFLADQVALLEDVFGNATVVPCSSDFPDEPDNVIVIAEKR